MAWYLILGVAAVPVAFVGYVVALISARLLATALQSAARTADMVSRRTTQGIMDVVYGIQDRLPHKRHAVLVVDPKKEDAINILNLSSTYDAALVISAHRQALAQVTGNAWMVARVNEARDVLLKG